MKKETSVGTSPGSAELLEQPAKALTLLPYSSFFFSHREGSDSNGQVWEPMSC